MIKQTKKKHNWMKGFTLPKRLDPLAYAQLESKLKTLNDLKKKKRK